MKKAEEQAAAIMTKPESAAWAADYIGGKMDDLSYRKCDSFFTQFYANTAAGVIAWRQIAKHTDGTGRVLNSHVKSTLQQLRNAGYSVSCERKLKINDDELLDAFFN
jgi:hypothetical protein